MKLILLTALVIGAFLLLFGCNEVAIESDVPIAPETFNSTTFCEGESSFILPFCLHSVALYNQDIAVCDEIPTSTDREQAYQDSCKETLQKGTFAFKKYIIAVNGLTDDPYFEECQKACENKDLLFVTPTATEYMYAPVSFNGIQRAEDGKGEKLYSCYCFSELPYAPTNTGTSNTIPLQGDGDTVAINTLCGTIQSVETASLFENLADVPDEADYLLEEILHQDIMQSGKKYYFTDSAKTKDSYNEAIVQAQGQTIVVKITYVLASNNRITNFGVMEIFQSGDYSSCPK